MYEFEYIKCWDTFKQTVLVITLTCGLIFVFFLLCLKTIALEQTHAALLKVRH